MASLPDSLSSLCFFVSSAADDGEPEGLSSFLGFFLKCRRRRRARHARHHLLHLNKNHHLLHLSKKTRMKKKKKKSWCIFTCHKCTSYFGGAFFATPLQQCLLQHCFNTTLAALLQQTCATLSSVATFQDSLCSTIFCNIVVALEWRRGLGLLMGRR